MLSKHQSRSEYITIRKLKYHIRHWGEPGAPVLFMLHGWMDVSASFQFMVESLQRNWHVIAPDWRGFGLSGNLPSDTAWYADYLADLDALLEHYSPGEPARLIGHSMGGNVAMVYAGIRPERVRKLVNLEGVGLQPGKPEDAPARYAQWLNELRDPPLFRPYANKEEVAKRLQANNPRLTNKRAAFLAGHWAAEKAGRWKLLADPAHRVVHPVLYRIDEITACWKSITAPVLWVEAEDSIMWRWTASKDEIRQEMDRRIGFVSDLTFVRMEEAGHMVHHDQPERLADIIEAFLDDQRLLK
jgi:pimeloyl-ACP methyl ester carboxylesterase